MTSPLVSTGWLAQRLHAPNLRVVDTSWYLPALGREARAEYLDGHIPGAVFFDLDAASDPTSSLPHMLPPAEQFAARAGALGIGPETMVVVYDGSGVNLSAPRIWWMFRVFGHRLVAVLDGGLKKWRAEGRPLETGPLRPRPERFVATLDTARLRRLEQVRAALADRSEQVVDMRPKGRYDGTEPEPRPGVPSGHMPGAVNLPYDQLVQPDGTLWPEDELRRRIAAAGIALDRPIIATCGSGTSACALLFVLDSLGIQDWSLYDGSWAEWAARGGAIARDGEP
jgi:thiosulfate/3-mercaptopyruvate sulfurtransferase